MIKLLIIMILLHIVDDFGLQHITHLNKMKQKSWWKREIDKDEADTY